MCSLKVRFSQNAERRGVYSYALKIEVVDSSGISPKIFVYHQFPAGLDGNAFAEFSHVASPVEMQEMPENAASEIVPWYRSDKVVVWFRCASDLDLAKQMFIDDISALQKGYRMLSSDNSFEMQDTVEFSDSGVSAL